jgi:ubiquinone/menaquinone biosynthesis C-methylase UbiE
MPEQNDLQRLRQEYSNRETRLQGKELYSFFSPAYLFAVQQRVRATMKLFRRKNFGCLQKKTILEVGCGSGGVLIEYLSYGADALNLYGIDLLYPRLRDAHSRLSSSKFINADGQNLPYPSQSFDIVLQYTAFSSVLDQKIKQNMALEMLRVLKHDGAIIWYDFWLNPTNKQTRGIRPAEIRSLFPNCQFEFHKITLAPPIARLIVPKSWGMALFLESLQLFNSHYLVYIHRQQS